MVTSKTERVVERLLTEPVPYTDLEARLREASPKHARRLLLDRLVAGGLAQQQLEQVRDALAFLGTGQEQEQQRLLQLAQDERRPLEERGTAYFLLGEQRGTLPLTGREQLQEVVPRQLLRHLREQPERAVFATQILFEADREGLWEAGLARLERLRADAGMPAALLYGNAICDPELGPERHAELLRIVASEDCAETVALLSVVLLGTEEMEPREQVRDDWARARVARAQRHGGDAWVSTPDASGEVALLGWFRDRPAGDEVDARTLVMVRIGGGRVLESLLEPWADEPFVEGFLDDYADTRGVDFAELALPEAWKLLRETAGDDPAHAPARRMFELHG